MPQGKKNTYEAKLEPSTKSFYSSSQRDTFHVNVGYVITFIFTQEMAE